MIYNCTTFQLYNFSTLKLFHSISKESVVENVETLVGVDLGTTKISVIIAEVDENGLIQVVGVGNTPSRGLRRGVVVNIDKTTEAIHEAISQAEQMAGTKVKNVYVGIAGDHIRSINSRGVIAVSRNNRLGRSNVISQMDVDRVIEAARAVALPMDREVLHVLPQEFSVDNELGVKDPIGLTGLRLEADVHIITGAVASAQNICRCLRSAGLGVRGLVLEPLASSFAVLTEGEKELGVAIIDLGGGTADMAVFNEGSIRHTAVVGLGGQNVTLDIAKTLGIAIETAEQLKIEHGSALLPEPNAPPLRVPAVGNESEVVVEQRKLNDIIRYRMEEIFELVFRELRRVDCLHLLSAGIVITGGASLLKGTRELAQEIFGMPARTGIPKGLDGLASTVHNPAFATGVGLILYGLESEDSGQVSGDDSDVFSRIFRIFKGWFKGLID